MTESDEDTAKRLFLTIADSAIDAGFVVPYKSHTPYLVAARVESQVSSCVQELDQFVKGTIYTINIFN
jgi:hypothetical protein